MKKEDYQALQEMLKEFREEAAELQARIEKYEERVKEAELYLKAIQDSEPEDRKVFSPRRVEVLYKEEIGRIKEEKAVHEEQIQRLCSQREVLEKRISYLRGLLIKELAGREEGYTDGTRLIPGRRQKSCLSFLPAVDSIRG